MLVFFLIYYGRVEHDLPSFKRFKQIRKYVQKKQKKSHKSQHQQNVIWSSLGGGADLLKQFVVCRFPEQP